MSFRFIRANRALLLLGFVALIFVSGYVRASEDTPATQPSLKSLEEIERIYSEEVDQLRLELNARLSAIHERRLADLEAARKQAMLDDNLDLANLIRGKIDEARRVGPVKFVELGPVSSQVDPDTQADAKQTLAKSVVFIVDASMEYWRDKIRDEHRATLAKLMQRFGEDTDVAVLLTAENFEPLKKFDKLTAANRDTWLESVTNTGYTSKCDPSKQINNAFQLKPEEIWYISKCWFDDDVEKYANQIRRLKATNPSTSFHVSLLKKPTPKERDAANRLAREGGGRVEYD